MSTVFASFRLSLFLFAGVLAAMFMVLTPGNSALTPVNDSGAAEANLIHTVVSGKTPSSLNTSILDTLYGAGNYARIDDSVDQLWSSTQGTANVVAKFAGNTEIIGYYNGGAGPINAGTFNPLFTVSGSEYSVSGSAVIPISSLFRFGLETSPEQGTVYLSSLVGDNADLLDHMVTFQIVGNAGGFINNQIGNYVLAFEDLLTPLSDRDFNDAVFEVSGVHVNVPEPAVYLLLGSGLTLALLFKKRKTIQELS